MRSLKMSREKKNCATVHPHQKYLAFIPLSKSQTKPGPSCSTSLLLSSGFFVAFSTYFAMYFLLFVWHSKSNFSSKLGQGSLTGVWGTWQVLYGRVGGCSVWLLILLWLTTYTCLRQVSHCRTVDMEICSKFNSKYQVAPGKLFEKEGYQWVVRVAGYCVWQVELVLCVSMRSANCAGNKRVRLIVSA